MKHILLSSVALLGLTVGATAADLPRRAVAPAPFVAVPVFTWTGFYVGVNAGYGWSDRDDHHYNPFLLGGSGLSVPACGVADCFNNSLTVVPPAPGALVPINITSGLPAGFGFTGFGHDRRDRDGFVGGGQIGFNYQFTPGSGFVIGFEADAQYADFGRRGRDGFYGFGLPGFDGFVTTNTDVPVRRAFPTLPGGPFTSGGTGVIIPGTPLAGTTGVTGPANIALFNNALQTFDRGRIEWFGTVRGRLGYAFDRLLVYATGGLAYTDRDNDRDGHFGFGFGGFANGADVVARAPTFFGTTAAGGTSSAIGNRQNSATGVHPTGQFGFRHWGNNLGWTVGGGIEYAFTNNLTLKLEGLYVSFDNDRDEGHFGFGRQQAVVGVTNTGAPVYANQLALGVDNRRNDDFAVVRAGLNYKFNGF